MAPIAPALAFNRFGLGPRPGDLRSISSDPRADLLAELSGADAVSSDSALMPSAALFLALRRFQVARAAANKAGDARMIADLGRPPQVDAYLAELAERMKRARAAQVGFIERLVAFWSNHFAVSLRANGFTYALVGSFEREAIRPHVLGKFHEMLLAVVRHPAMLFYLDNVNSFGPNSDFGLSRNRGLNENLARELLELHTVGVDGGYSQADVTQLARVLTGWTVVQSETKPLACGRFAFMQARHEPGPATVMGVAYPQDGQDQGEAVLFDLARSPAAARHLARKLAIHFVADDPPAALVDSLASTFLDTDGDLRAMAAALVGSEAASAPPTKLKTPQEFVWSSLRALSLDVEAGFVRRVLATLGAPLWNPPSPQGFSDDSAAWLAPDAMTNRLDIATDLASRAVIEGDPGDLARGILGDTASQETMTVIAKAETRTQALALMLMSPEFQRR